VSKTSIIFFRDGDLERPVLKVETKGDKRVVIVIRGECGEHLTLHRKDDGSVIFTHWSADKPVSTWDQARAVTARAMRWRSPERHRNYLSNRPLYPEPIIGMDGHQLAGRYINLAATSPKEKYQRFDRMTLDAPAPEFMLYIHLSTPGQPFSKPSAPHIATSFGDLYFTTARWPVTRS